MRDQKQQIENPPSPEQSHLRGEDFASGLLGQLREEIGAARAAWETGDRSKFAEEVLEVAQGAVQIAQTVTTQGLQVKPGPSGSAADAFYLGVEALQQTIDQGRQMVDATQASQKR